MSSNSHDSAAVRPDRITLVLQGGGALGAYQAGVYEALDEAGMRPDWVIGTSTGAINASLIAGNPPEARLERLKAFWRRVEHGQSPLFGSQLANFMTMTRGGDPTRRRMNAPKGG